MAFAIAQVSHQRGAAVTVVAGVTRVPAPPNVKLLTVTSAEEMYRAVKRELNGASVFVGAAAVADYRPVQPASEKIKKHNKSLTLTLERTKDILSEVASIATDHRIVIGFAAETENLLENARAKLDSKKLDLVIANDVARPDTGFDSENNAITIIRRGSATPTQLPVMTKSEAAHRILDEVVRLRRDSASLSAVHGK